MTETTELAEVPASEAPAQPGESREWLRSVLVMLVTCIVLGLLMAAVWMWIAPRPQIQVESGSAFYLDIGQAGIGMDMTFGLLALAAGILTGAIVLALCRKAGIELTVLAAVAGFLGSYLALRVATTIVGGFDAEGEIDIAGKANGEVFLGPLQLHAYGVMAIWSFLAVVVITIGFAVKAQRTLRAARLQIEAEGSELETSEPEMTAEAREH